MVRTAISHAASAAAGLARRPQRTPPRRWSSYPSVAGLLPAVAGLPGTGRCCTAPAAGSRGGLTAFTRAIIGAERAAHYLRHRGFEVIVSVG